MKQHRRLSISAEVLKHLAKLKLDLAQLQSIPIFAPLPASSLEKIIPLLRLRRMKTGTDIIRQGDLGQYLYVIAKGKVLVVHERGQTGEELLATLSERECFGEMSLISGEPVSATIRASTPVTLLVLSKDDFDLLLMETPSLNVYFTKLLAQRLQQANTKMMEILDKGMLGSIKTFTIPELVQTLTLNVRTGTLTILDKDARSEIHFHKGDIYQVLVGDLRGEHAFYQLLEWKDGQFQFQPAESLSMPRKIHKDSMHLLMEGLRRLDEGQERLSGSQASP
jgi:CRP-like cAMP-binding protein